MKKPAKSLRKVVWLHDGLLPVHIAFCPSEYAWNKLMKKFKVPDPDPWHKDGRQAFTATFYGQRNGAANFIVSINHDKNAHDTYLTIVHEAVHVWQFTCDHMAERRPGIEMEAYSIEHIVDGLIKAYGKTHGKIPKSKKWWGRK